jgi:DNA-binding GntR family transcriptional regulator
MSSPRGLTITRGVSLREQVTRSLRIQLFTGRLRPGDTFSVPSLAEEFGVSATPVREAVLELVQRRLVEVIPAKGYRVVEASEDEIRETVEVRRLLELPGTRLAADLSTADDLERLRQMADQTVRYAELGRHDDFVVLDHDFHVALLEIAGNATLVRIIEELRNRARLHIAGAISESGRWGIHVAREHVQLVDAMEARDHDLIDQIVVKHMSYALAPDEAGLSRSEASI